MPMSKGEEVLAKALTDSHAENTPNASMIDPTMIITIIGMILDFIKGCRNPASAEARIRQGGALSFAAVRKALKAGGYQGDIRGTARSMTRKGETCTQEELDAVLADAADVPQPPSSDGPWPFVIAVACVLGFGSMATASDGPWPQIAQDVTEIKREVTTLGSAVVGMSDRMEDMERKLDQLVAASVRPVIVAPEPPPEPTIAPPQKVAERSVASGVTLNGMSIGDVNAYIRQNPAGYVGVNGSLDLHLRQHGFGGNLSSLSQSQKQSLHNIAHARGMPARTIYHTSPSTAAPAASGCANGQCSRPSYGYSTIGMRQGLFGNWRPIRR